MIKSFEKQFKNEIHKNEIIRTTIIAFLVMIFFIGFTLVMFFTRNIIVNDYNNLNSIYIAAGILFSFAAREFVIRIFLKKKVNLPLLRPKFRYFNIFFEVTLLSTMFYVLISNAKTIAVLNSPVVLIYFIIILSTTLTIDFKISLFTGLLSAFQYLALIIYAASINLITQNDSSMIFDIRFYAAPALFMIMTGIITGIIGIQLRKRIISTFKNLEDKNKIRNMFGQQVSQEIVDELTEGAEFLESKRLFVCVMFLDIRNFTNYAENKDPKEIIKFQNNVFGFMIDIIIKHKGVINQFLGDGYMATFGIPFSRGNDVQNAVDASLEIINILNERIKQDELPDMRIGIGLHAGNVVAGNVGTEQRKQYSVSGETVIIASRIEQLNKHFNSQLLVSEDVYNNSDFSKITYNDLGLINVKGKENPIRVYQLN